MTQKFFYCKKPELLKKQRKRPAEATLKIEKKYWLNIYREYLFCLEFNASDSFLETCINFVEQRLKFSHFEGSIIPHKIIHNVISKYQKLVAKTNFNTEFLFGWWYCTPWGKGRNTAIFVYFDHHVFLKNLNLFGKSRLHKDYLH